MVLCVCVCFLQKYPSPSVQDSANRSGGEEEEEEEVHRVNLFICNPSLSNFLFSPRAVFSPPIHLLLLPAGGGRKKKEKKDVLCVSQNDFSLF